MDYNLNIRWNLDTRGNEPGDGMVYKIVIGNEQCIGPHATVFK